MEEFFRSYVKLLSAADRSGMSASS